MIVLIFEGADKTGKTTLIKEISVRNPRVICVDRHVASQYIYSKFYKRKNSPNLSECRHLERCLASSDITHAFVHVTCDYLTAQERYKNTNEKDIDIEYHDEIKDLFRQYFYESSLPVINVDTTGKTINECAIQILNCLGKLHSI